MKAIARTLQITGFVATFVAFAYSLAYSVDPGDCKRVVIGPLGWLGTIVTLGLVLGFGAVSRGEFSKTGQLWVWGVSTVFFAAQAKFLQLYDSLSFGEKWQALVEVFVPEPRFGHWLEALGAFYVDIAHVWMPLVSLVSICAFVFTLGGGTDIRGTEEIVVPDRSSETESTAFKGSGEN